MNNANLHCQDEQRRRKVREGNYNGLDFIELLDERTLKVHFLGKAPQGLTKENIRLSGGRRIRDIRVVNLKLCNRKEIYLDDCMIITLDKTGDFSTYTLCVVEVKDGQATGAFFPGFDPRYACLDFSFKMDCPSDLDCQPTQLCPPEPRVEPEINYLAKDYASFRQLILDRLALIMPEWQERHVPDIGIALVEILAYAGDHLSYYQDAVASEAYLDTARLRISIRRHARLVDYAMHEGCNARAWVYIHTAQNASLPPDTISFITGYNEALPVSGRVLTWDDLADVPAGRYEVFEPLFEELGSPQLQMKDIKYPMCLASKLWDIHDPVSQYLRSQFAEKTHELLTKYQIDTPPSAELLQALLDELNRLIQAGSSLYHKEHFSQVELSEETAKLLGLSPQGELLVRLNRALLEETYPQEIARSRKPDDPIRLYEAHNEINFYTWGDRECCLPRGATAATLKDKWLETTPSEASGAGTYEQKQPPKEPSPVRPCERARWLRHLQPGDILIFEEVIGPKTNLRADADPAHRHIVRLTGVKLDVDPLDDQPVVEITWAEADALPFPLCLSAIGPAPECQLIENISVVRGNIILVDHGRRIKDESLGCVPLKTTAVDCKREGQPADPIAVPGRFTPPPLQKAPLTFSQALPGGLAAAAMLTQDPRQATPWIELTSVSDPECEPKPPSEPPGDPAKPGAGGDATPAGQTEPGSVKAEAGNDTPAASSKPVRPTLQADTDESAPPLQWTAQGDLLASNAQDAHFVVEIDNAGRAHVRFGDGELGQMPEARTKFTATYRVGNGLAGNVGAEAISHLVSQNLLSGLDLEPRNPLPARGGIAPEPIEEVKLFAPHAFRRYLERAITADDYAEIVMRDFKDKVQRAAAVLRWTGSWYEVLVTVDPRGQVAADPALLTEIQGHLYRYRRIGYDLVVKWAEYVPLDIEMRVCVLPHYLAGHVKAALLDRLSNRTLLDGQRGFFHPDNLTFGEGIYLSKLVAIVQAVPGVESVTINKLERLYEGPNHELADGLLRLSPLEIARLDNDPNYPENGRLKLTMRGGR